MPGSGSASRLCNLGNLKESCCHILQHLWYFWKLENEYITCGSCLNGLQELGSFKFITTEMSF